MQPNLGAETNVSGSRDERVWERMRPRLPPRSLTGIGGRGKDMGALGADCNAGKNGRGHRRLGVQNPEKIKLSGSALAAEICAAPHNRLWRRQHCSSLYSQSEGHEHVANMTNALGHNFVGFSARAGPPQYSSPSLCEQSELQCFAPGLRHTLLFSKRQIFLDFEHPTLQGALSPLYQS